VRGLDSTGGPSHLERLCFSVDDKKIHVCVFEHLADAAEDELVGLVEGIAALEVLDA
jgi:hypothetical protein